MDRRALLVFLAQVALVAACSSSSGSKGAAAPTPNAPPLLQQDCDPIVPSHCGFPYPSNVWTVPDSTQATGMHVYFGDTTLPAYDTKGDHVDKTPFDGRDGFSPAGGIMATFPGATITGLADAYHIDQSLQPTSPTILMEYDTGTLVPHWAELDSLQTTVEYDTDNETDANTFFIRPALRLKDNTRYLVAVRNLVDASGNVLPPSPVFKALRDNTASNDLSVAPRRALYADILGKLSASGVDTSQLQLAWDFTTASKQDTTQWMVHMRDDALATVGAAGPSYTYTNCIASPSGPTKAPCGITDNPNPYIRRRIVGQMTVPLYLNNPDPGASLNLVNGMPAQNGTATFEFLVQIPNSLVNSGKAGPIIQNAHGLFGDQTEGQDSYMAETCDREGYVEIAVDLVGMASDDGSGYVPNLIAGDISGFDHVVHRMHQGFINELLAMRMMMGGMSTDPATQFNGKPTIDPTQRFYRGDSQGGISGGVYMAISTDVTRGLLGEPGAPYNTLLDRSADFNGFFLIIKGTYPNPLDIQLGLGLIQSLWDRAEPAGYVSYITGNDTLPNTPSHNVLLHVAIGDQQVTPLGAHFIARTVGAQNLKTTNRDIYGIPDADSGFSGNGMCEWDFGLPASQSPVTNTPPDSNLPDPHDSLRQQADAQDMSDTFFRTGTVVQTCPNGGPCAAPSDWSSTSILPPVSALDGGAYEDGGAGGDTGTTSASTGDGGTD